MRIAKTINTQLSKCRSKLTFERRGSGRAYEPTTIKAWRTLAKIGISLTLSLLVCNKLALAQSIIYDSNGLKIELSEDVQAAIDSGVSLTFENEFAHTRNFFFIRWHSELVKHDFVITRHTLSNRYLVHESNKLEPRIFSSTHETMTYISEAALDRFSKYHSRHPHSLSLSEHKMRLRLSKTKLPGPMRLTAFIASDWDLDSGWKLWQSDQ